MNHSRSARWLAVVLSSFPLAAGCCHTPAPDYNPDLPPELRKTAESMDRIAAGLEEFGSASVSSPLLAVPDDRFAFDLAVTADKLYEEAKSNIQGRAADFQQVVQSLALGAGVQLDPTITTAYEAQLRQFQQQQALADQTLAAQAQQRALRDRAANTEFAESLRQAYEEPDAAQRAAMVAAAQRKLAESLSSPGVTTPPTPPSPPTAELPALPTDLAKQPTDAAGRLAANQFAAAQSLYKTPAIPGLSNRQAMFIAQGDVATRAIFSLWGSPDVGKQFEDKRVVFGVVTVAVNPGWRTRKGYAADLSVISELTYEPAGRDVVERFIEDERFDLALRKRVAQDYDLTPPDGNTQPLQRTAPVPSLFRVPGPPPGAPAGAAIRPLATAISPMTETQVLDLESGRRRRDEFALSLAFALRYAGLGAQAQAFEQFVKSRERDVATRTPGVAVNTYSHSGGMFGFQVGPRLTALESPTSNAGANPAMVLERQSFPALVIFGFDQREIDPKVIKVFMRSGVEKEVAGDDQPATQEENDSIRFRLLQPEIRFAAVTQWLPIRPGKKGKAPVRLGETTRLGWSWDLRESQQALSVAQTAARAKGTADPIVPVGGLADLRIEALRNKAFGSATGAPLPLDFILPPPEGAAPNPKVTEILPAAVTLARDGGNAQARDEAVYVFGDDLDQIALDKITVVGNPGHASVSAGTPPVLRGGAIKVTLRLSGEGPPAVLELPLKQGNRSVYSLPLTVSVAPGPRPATAAAVIQRTTGPASDPARQTLDRVEFSPGTAPDLVRAEIEKAKAAPAAATVDVNVNASDRVGHQPAAGN